MQVSNAPTSFPIPFANGAGAGYIRTIPQASQISTTPGAASLTDGFPPLNFLPVSAGGVPPFGQDMNGILYETTLAAQWLQAGWVAPYNSTFSTAIGGYPKGAVIPNATYSGAWMSTADNNTTNPDTGGAGWSAAFMSGTVGAVRNLVMSVTTASASATLTADEIVVGSAFGGQKFVLPSFSKTINLATTGAGGMDTGTAPVSGYVALYAIYNPTTGTAALLATNATSAVAPSVYGGANMPSGYTASGLIAVVPTNGSSQFPVLLVRDRDHYIASVTVLNVTALSASFTSFSIAGAVPKNAISCAGSVQMTDTSVATLSYGLAGSSAGVGATSNTGQNTQQIGGAFGSVPIVTAQTLFYQNSASVGASITTVVAITSYRIG